YDRCEAECRLRCEVGPVRRHPRSLHAARVPRRVRSLATALRRGAAPRPRTRLRNWRPIISASAWAEHRERKRLMTMQASPMGISNGNVVRNSLSSSPGLVRTLGKLATIRSCRRGEEICRKGQVAQSWYRMVSGTARCCVLRPDGRQQITDLLLAG